MNTLIPYFGYTLVACGIVILAIMAVFALRMQQLEAEDRKTRLQRLIILNFSGIGLALIGLMLLVLSTVF